MDKLKLAYKTKDLIYAYIQAQEDYSLLLELYNRLVIENNLDMPKMKWINSGCVELI